MDDKLIAETWLAELSETANGADEGELGQGSRWVLTDQGRVKRDRDRLRLDLLTRALQALEGAWQPIETAPKDGTEFVAYRPLAHKTNDPAIAVVRGTPTASKSPQGVEHYTDRWCHPTHWLPLPAPPIDHQVEGDRSR